MKTNVIALQIPRPLNKRAIFSDFPKIFELIETDNLELIRDFFEDLIPEDETTLLNSTFTDESLLFFAASLGKFDICRYLLRLSLEQGREQMCKIWKTQCHPLTAAIKANHSRLIRLIVRNLYNINDTVTSCYTPLMLAVLSNKLWFIKMVVRLGADVNLSCGLAGNPLTSSCLSRGGSCFLVEHGATIDQKDENGNTALHGAVMGNQMETVRYLVEAGANVCIRCHKGYTPLILSALTMSENILDYLTEHVSYSQMDRIEAFEIFNACLVLYGSDDIDIWLPTLEMRKHCPKQINVPVHEVFELSVEFTTEQELLDIRNNQLLLAYQGALVIGRIFGLFTGMYVKSIVQTAITAKREGNFEKLRELIDYIQTICQRQNLYSLIFDESESIKELFVELFWEARPDDGFVNGAFTLFQMVAKAASERWSFIKSRYTGRKSVLDDCFKDIIDLFLQMVYAFYILRISAENREKCFAVVKELVKDNPRVDCQQTLLHRALTPDNYPNSGLVEHIEVLIEAGVDVNSKDYFRQTPLIYAVKYQSVFHYELIECLLKHGAHLDCQSSEGFYATDFLLWNTPPKLPRGPIALSCQAVRVILENNIPYETTLPKIMKNFVDLHK